MDTGIASRQIRLCESGSGEPLEQTAATSTVIEKEFATLRRLAWIMTDEIGEGHRKTREWRLEDRTAVQARSSVRELLDELAVDQGMTWSSIARLCGVSLSAVRKWRYGEGPSTDSRLAVAQLVAFVDLLTEMLESEPATWFAMPMVSNYTITAEDLYIAGFADLLLDFASGRTELNDVLNSFDEDWRTRYQSDYEVVKAGDNNPSIVRRT